MDSVPSPVCEKQPCASSLRGALQSHVDFEIISSDMLIYISNAEIIHFSFVWIPFERIGIKDKDNLTPVIYFYPNANR